jgi:hypothetical protein
MASAPGTQLSKSMVPPVNPGGTTRADDKALVPSISHIW